MATTRCSNVRDVRGGKCQYGQDLRSKPCPYRQLSPWIDFDWTEENPNSGTTHWHCHSVLTAAALGVISAA